MESTSIFYHPEQPPNVKVEVDKIRDSYCLSIESASKSKAITINLFFSSFKEIIDLKNNIHNAIANMEISDD
jgi:hypothetical protein